MKIRVNIENLILHCLTPSCLSQESRVETLAFQTLRRPTLRRLWKVAEQRRRKMRWQAGAKGVKGVKVTVQRIVISMTLDCSWPKLYISNEESWFFAFCPELFHIRVPTRLLSFVVQAAACNKFRTRTWTQILISVFFCSWPMLPQVTTLDHILFGFCMWKPGTSSAEATFKPCSKWI